MVDLVAQATAPLLRLQQVSYCFAQSGPEPALRDIDLQVNPGDRLALVGPSGAGKSTLLQLLNGSLTPSAGAVQAFGQNLVQTPLRQRRKLQRRIGTVYQQFHLVPTLRVIHNVNAGHLGRWSWPRALASLVFPQALDQAERALTQVGIPELLYARTDQLSGGQQQRVAIARVLIQDPPVILADEPIASLDPERSREVMALLTTLCAEQGRALVVSLHDLEMAQRFCDRIVGLRQGRVVFDEKAEDLRRSQVKALYELTANGPTPNQHNGQ